jgi:hypothetical protein
VNVELLQIYEMNLKKQENNSGFPKATGFAALCECAGG